MGTYFNPEQYHRPDKIEAVTHLLQQDGAKVIAGGTDLLVNKPPKIHSLIDITNLGLDYVTKDGEGVAIGATTSFSNIIASPYLVLQPYSILKDSAREVGHYNIRHIATIGGNICNAVPSADSPIALIALDAVAMIEGPNGQRVVPLDGFFTFVRETVLSQVEFLREIRIPVQCEKTGASFQKIGRTKVDIALVNAACRLTLDGDGIKDPRIVLGAVAPKPIRARQAESMLDGYSLDEVVIDEVVEEAVNATSPIDDHRASADYRREMSRVLVKRAIHDAYEKAEVMP